MHRVIARRTAAARRLLFAACLCCVIAFGCNKHRRAPAATPSSEAPSAETSSADAPSAEPPSSGTRATNEDPERVARANGATPSAAEPNGQTQTKLTFQRGQATARLLPALTVGSGAAPQAVLNAGLPETSEEWEACQRARVNVRGDRAYPAVRLGRTIAVQEWGQQVALRLYPGLVEEQGLLTGHGLRRPGPCWVGAWEKLSDEAYYDHVTDRTWYLEASRRLDWAGALQYVAELNTASGDSGWRVPTSAEQLTLAAAYDQWRFTRVRFGAVTPGNGAFWSADGKAPEFAQPGFHTLVSLEHADIDYQGDRKASVLAVRTGRWSARPGAPPPAGRIVPGQRHPNSPYPVPGRVLSAGLTRVPEAVNQCAAAKTLYFEDGVFPPVRVVESIRLRSEPRRITLADCDKELAPFGFGVHADLPPICLTPALQTLGPNHFVEWVTGLEWQFLSDAPRPRITFEELTRALAERNARNTNATNPWRLPTFIELALLGGLSYAFWDFESQTYRRDPVWLADVEGSNPAKGRLCRETDSGAIENARQTYQGRCAALLVRRADQP
jgi:hypothetical protein